jgi:sarcosine oxidase
VAAPRGYDVAVVGLGAMGSQAALELASRGLRVLGLDRHRPPHTLGSTHGRTRIIREAYFEEPLYVPIVQRAYELWRLLEERSGARLLTVTGGLMLGAPDSEVVAGARASAVAHGLPYEELSAREVRERFPAYAVPEGHAAIFEPRAGFLEPEAAVEATLALAAEAGADLRFGERVLELEGGLVRTERGGYAADRVVVSAGPWLPELVPELAGVFTVARQPLLWLAPKRPELFGPDRFPIFVWEWQPGWAFYGFPDAGDGFKAAIHHHGEPTTPESVDRELRPADEEAIRALVRRFFPAGDGALREAAVCLYTNTPDEHFVIDRLPGDGRVIVASPCSGHGFKFAPAIGEVLADLATGGPPRFDLTPFGLGRLADTDEFRA